MRLQPTKDPLNIFQWNLSQIFAPDAWTITQGKEEVRIAVIDVGGNNFHEDMKGKFLKYPNEVDYSEEHVSSSAFTDATDDCRDKCKPPACDPGIQCDSHSQSVASIAAARKDNTFGAVQLAKISATTGISVRDIPYPVLHMPDTFEYRTLSYGAYKYPKGIRFTKDEIIKEVIVTNENGGVLEVTEVEIPKGFKDFISVEQRKENDKIKIIFKVDTKKCSKEVPTGLMYAVTGEPVTEQGCTSSFIAKIKTNYIEKEVKIDINE